MIKIIKFKKKIDNIAKSLNEENKFAILRRNLTNKSTSEVKNIVEKINRMQVDIGKVLLLGSAGIGKTTLMHYLSYKWGKEKLWNNKFDYVFRIRLKELLSWTVRYGTNIDDDILSCFVHYCLDSNDIKLEDIKSIQDKDRILLLLDGYDEVAFLSQSNRDDRDIMDSVFQYKNIVMSSRPNEVIEEMSNRFEQKVDNTGWDSEGIEQYVHKNFEYDKELGTPLKIFLDTHGQIKEICAVPINTALICLI
ncbi:NACHT domain-containing protein [Rickettsia sibirica]|uniref:NACHT domain-containing protein n=1 Tax=Rickettsia sibirica TaxID=35793 RepID=UPI0002DBD463|nr:NACHT domain-containing protein [Rickettsia sibirica]